MALIKVNGYKIDPDKIGMIERIHSERSNGDFDGIRIVFAAGGSHVIPDPDGFDIEMAFEHYDSKAYSELPY